MNFRRKDGYEQYRSEAHGNKDAEIMNRLIDVILVDDDVALADMLEIIDGGINGTFITYWYTLPPILDYNPPYVALPLFFGAPKCFNLFTMLEFDEKQKDDAGRSIEHFAAAGGNMEIIRELESRGRKFQDHDVKGYTPVHYAVQMGHLDLIQWFWTRGVNLKCTVRSSVSLSPIDLAAMTGREDIVRFLIDVVGDSSGGDLCCKTLHYACQAGNVAIVKFLIDRDYEINRADEKGKTPLAHAAQNGYLTCVKALVEADPSIVNGTEPRRCHPLIEAAAYANCDIVEYLIQHGSDPNIVCDGTTALLAAVSQNHTLVARILSSETDVDKAMFETLLLRACQFGNVPLMKHIIKSHNKWGPLKNQQTDVMKQAIMVQADNVVGYLLSIGFSVRTLPCKINRTHMEFMRYLLRHGYTAGLAKKVPPKDIKLLTAVWAGNLTEIRNILGKEGMDKKFVERYANTALSVIMDKKQVTILNLMIRNKPDLSDIPPDDILAAVIKNAQKLQRYSFWKRDTEQAKLLGMLESLLRCGFMSKEPHNKSRYLDVLLNNRNKEIIEMLRRYNLDFSDAKDNQDVIEEKHNPG